MRPPSYMCQVGPLRLSDDGTHVVMTVRYNPRSPRLWFDVALAYLRAVARRRPKGRR